MTDYEYPIEGAKAAPECVKCERLQAELTALRATLGAREQEIAELNEEVAGSDKELQRICKILAVESDDAFDIPFTDEEKAELAVDYDEWMADRKQRAEDAEVGKQIRLARLAASEAK